MTESSTVPSKAMLWTGRVLSALPVLGLVMSSIMKLTHNPAVLEGFGKFGYPESSLTAIGLVELVCALLYAIPQTSVLGAILVDNQAFNSAAEVLTREEDRKSVV